MNRNVRVVLGVSALFGAATGTYEFVLPYYLRERGLSFESMGLIFAIASAGMLAGRVLMGEMADRWGRKLFYGLSLAGNALAMGLTPATGSTAGQSVLKTLREAMLLTRETLHPIVLYEESRGRFMAYMGKTRGCEYLFQGAGTLASGALMARLGTVGNLELAAAVTAIGFLWFWTIFREHPRDLRARPQGGGLRQLLSFEMHRNLKLITISVFIFNVGLMTSHCFIMPLFFSEKFGVTAYTVSWVMVVHRITIAFPLLVAGRLPIRDLKGVYVWTLALEGAILSASALIPSFLAASAVWLLHDLVGAGIWIPVQNQLIQDYTEPEQRGLQVGKVLAFGGLGTIPGPLLAGYLSGRQISAPFFVSGVLMVIAVLPLAWLRLDAPPCAGSGHVLESR